MDATITVPGWVWLLATAAGCIIAVWRMVVRYGLRELVFFEEYDDPNRWVRLFVFILIIGIAVICVLTTIEHLLG